MQKIGSNASEADEDSKEQVQQVCEYSSSSRHKRTKSKLGRGKGGGVPATSLLTDDATTTTTRTTSNNN